jgi:hypothetical protein
MNNQGSKQVNVMGHTTEVVTDPELHELETAPDPFEFDSDFDMDDSDFGGCDFDSEEIF